MKATEAKLLVFLKKSTQFIIPIYQRQYSWTEKECSKLWDDIIRAGQNDDIAVHFIGSIVYIEEGLSQVSNQSPLQVIDGQQRLTSVILLIEALARALDKPEALGETETSVEKEPVEGFSARKLRNYYLRNPEEKGELRFKLLLSQTDKTTLMAITGDGPEPQVPSLRVEANLKLFEDWIKTRRGELAAICRGLAKLVIVDIALGRDQDNPQLIFESMNSTGRKLSQADLIRNFVLMDLEPEPQTRLYEHYWRPMEEAFGQEAYNTHFDGFMRHYLIARTGEIPRQDLVYEAFKELALREKMTGAAIEPLVKEMADFARYYCRMALAGETIPELKRAFDDLRELKVEVAYPLLLELYSDFEKGVLAKEDFVAIVRLVEAYVFRRAICAIPTNSHNRTFAAFTRTLKKDRYLESVRAHFLLMLSYRRFPDDDEFERLVQERDLYNFWSRSYWLRKLENFGRKERVNVGEYTVEHIMPQNGKLSPAWKAALGDEWQRVHQTWLHKLGNLTLTGYNSEYGDRPFTEKRDMEGGFRDSPLRLNKGLGEVDVWNEDAIRARARRLAPQFLKVWQMPFLPAEILEEYRNPSAPGTSYSVADHPNLLSGAMAGLFAAFRQAVLALDPCVSEEVLEHYVAYKAETHFVEVLPEDGQLRILLNMKFVEINDPRGLCGDVSGLDSWGNGDVALRLSSNDELPYVLGLVRQSLERQLGSEMAE